MPLAFLRSWAEPGTGSNGSLKSLGNHHVTPFDVYLDSKIQARDFDCRGYDNRAWRGMDFKSVLWPGGQGLVLPGQESFESPEGRQGSDDRGRQGAIETGGPIPTASADS